MLKKKTSKQNKKKKHVIVLFKYSTCTGPCLKLINSPGQSVTFNICYFFVLLCDSCDTLFYRFSFGIQIIVPFALHYKCTRCKHSPDSNFKLTSAFKLNILNLSYSTF